MKTMKTISEILTLGPVVPVLTIDDARNSGPACPRAGGGGLPAIEVTLRTAASPASHQGHRRRGPRSLVGAGTILNPKHYEEAVTAARSSSSAPAAPLN